MEGTTTTNSPTETQNTNTNTQPPPVAPIPIPTEALQVDVTTESEFYDGTLFDLPFGWVVEHRPRTNDKYLGKIDQFYYEPVTRKQFRSLKSVSKYLENIEIMKAIISKPRSSVQPPNETQLSSSTQEKKKNKRKRNLSFDFENPPTSVTWCLKDAGQDLWSPEVEDSEILGDHWTHIFNTTTIASSNSNQVSSAGASGST